MNCPLLAAGALTLAAAGETARQPMGPRREDAAVTRWENKKVLGSRLVDDMEDPAHWVLEGSGELTFTGERSRDGGHSLRQTVRESALNASLGGNLDLRPTNPGRLGVVKLDLAGLVAHGVEDLDLRGFNLGWQGQIPGFYASGVAISALKNLRVDGFRGRAPHAGSPALLLSDGDGLVVRNSVATAGELLMMKAVTGPKLLAGNEAVKN